MDFIDKLLQISEQAFIVSSREEGSTKVDMFRVAIEAIATAARITIDLREIKLKEEYQAKSKF